jgi:hypothetical protein
MNIEIPEDLYHRAAEIAKAHDVSVDTLFASAFVEQMAAWERLRTRAGRGDRDKFLAVLDKVAETDSDSHEGL